MFQSFLSFKRTSELLPGELFRIGEANEAQLAIVGVRGLNRADTGFFTLQSLGRIQAFQYGRSLRQTHVASFGTAWILEPTHYDGAWVGNRTHQELHGLLRIRADGAVLQGRPTNPIDDVFQFDVASGEILDTQYQETIPVFGWRIWANAHHRSTQGAQPLMTFEAAPPIANQD